MTRPTRLHVRTTPRRFLVRTSGVTDQKNVATGNERVSAVALQHMPCGGTSDCAVYNRIVVVTLLSKPAIKSSSSSSSSRGNQESSIWWLCRERFG
jgi:hypothetical protein